ncbi:4-hydroxy-tetrahydrodipicolinate reductase [hydrothermal vent metagenome]|uniref:4-hydroxy-tetrahydrodipicolinate reductase n=1 Tax=hydrothermal vent metagenome TaxID=652676 RepID=A0A3B1CZ22_9ZZZZ
MIKLAISGCRGRMGQSITRLAIEDKSFMIATLLEHKDHPEANKAINDMATTTEIASLQNADTLIEFTLPDGTMNNLQACLDHNVKMVIGTTGLTSEQMGKIKKASQTIPIVFASNMSVGVNVLFKLTEMTAAKTGSNYTINMSETHHVHKKDAPSGTAKTLAEIAEEASGQKVHNIESLREGEVIGDHSVVFESDEDIITISHHAKSRDIFAKGALVAAKFLADKEKGLFNMQDVLGLR